MDLELTGKVAVVTGASRGIGRAVVDTLLAEGVSVVAGARQVDGLAGVAGVTPVAVDLATREGAAELVARALDVHGGIDLLVNNVGAATLHPEGFTSLTDDDWETAFATNLLSHVRTTRAALPSIRERRGAIVNVSSLNGKAPAVESPAYSAMKAALLNLSRSLARELAGQGVRVNAVTPGPVATDMQLGPDGVAAQLGMPAADYLAAVDGAVPLGRMATAQEIADVVAFLLSPRSAYVTGADVAVDGSVAGG